jgi:2-polyprenyl-6-methoxyphenol hydroxylase-like FAD-dependent oxidoreductase
MSQSRFHRIPIVGTGQGGLAEAMLLSTSGFDVTVFGVEPTFDDAQDLDRHEAGAPWPDRLAEAG